MWLCHVSKVSFSGTLQCMYQYLCMCVCHSYCRQYNWTHGRPVLVRPYDSLFMSYESPTDTDSYHDLTADEVTDWLTRRLSEHIHNITSPSELQRDWLDFGPDTRRTNQIQVVICTASSRVPLFLGVLSVLTDGRVKFAQVTETIASQAELDLPPKQTLVLVIVTPEWTYTYGSGDADCMLPANVRLLLTQLAPSAADLLDFTITLSLLMLCLQPCLVYCGLKSRLASLISFSVHLGLLFFLYCFFVSYVIPEHELHSLLDGILPAWRYLMLTSFGDLVRRDWLRYTTVNFGSFIVTYFIYLLAVCWCYGRLCRQRKAQLCMYWDHVMLDDYKAYIELYTWQQFGVPDYWLRCGSDRSELTLSADVANTCVRCQWELSSGHSSDRPVSVLSADVADTCAQCQRELSAGHSSDRPVSALSADVTDTCASCQRDLSHGSKVCMSSCRHIFHWRCLADLIYSDQCQCPACQCRLYSDTPTLTP